MNIVIPRNIGSHVVTGIEPHLLNSDSFAKCIKSIDFPNTIRYIGPYSFFKAGIKKLKLPAMVNEIGDSAFSRSGIEEVTFLGDNLKILDPSVFCTCKHLKKINLPNELCYISEYCFNGCINLENIVIPPKVIAIKQRAFSYSGIKNIVFEGPVPLQIHKTAFDSQRNRTAYVKKRVFI